MINVAATRINLRVDVSTVYDQRQIVFNILTEEQYLKFDF